MTDMLEAREFESPSLFVSNLPANEAGETVVGRSEATIGSDVPVAATLDTVEGPSVTEPSARVKAAHDGLNYSLAGHLLWTIADKITGNEPLASTRPLLFAASVVASAVLTSVGIRLAKEDSHR